jgi:ubiquinone/menaquinone biosynthesis C-methylase UbiE
MQMKSANAQQEVNDYFESSSLYWKKIYSDDRLLPTIYQDRHNTALRWVTKLGLHANARILDAGCGAGLTTIAMASRGYRVDAIDATTSMIQIARRDVLARGVQDRVRLHFADVHALPFKAETFDLVIAIGLIPWLHSAHVALQEMYRVLKTGGYLLVTADNNARLNRILDPMSCPLFMPLRTAAKRLLQLCGAWSPASGFQPKRHYPAELDRLLAACRFKKLHSSTVGFGPFTLFGRKLFADPLSVRLHRWLHMLASAETPDLLLWTGSHYLMLAAKA